MKRSVIKVIICVLAVLLAAEVLFLIMADGLLNPGETTAPTTAPTTVPTTEPTTAPTTAPTTEPTTAPTTAPTTEPTTAPVLQEQRYTLTLVGDCTLGCSPSVFEKAGRFISVIGEDYDYPFREVVKYFENDDLTIANLEGVFANSGTPVDKLFTFRGPTAYTQILTGSSVEAVTLANNHIMDFGKAGYESTTNALDQAGVAYVEEDKTLLITTETGLVVGLYADSYTSEFSETAIAEGIAQLRRDGAEIVICAFHWGKEGSYRPNDEQKQLAHAAIDAGADIIYGHHPHVLQPIEEYNGGLILYSVGNFCFGGNINPRDKDSAIFQLEIIRDTEGKVSRGDLTIIPVTISSASDYNDYQPTPCKEGSKTYKRIMSKLDGTFEGRDLYVSYDN